MWKVNVLFIKHFIKILLHQDSVGTFLSDFMDNN